MSDGNVDISTGGATGLLDNTVMYCRLIVFSGSFKDLLTLNMRQTLKIIYWTVTAYK